MKIFLDVGAHEGQSLSAVLDPKYGFNKIFAFEPVKKLHGKLSEIAADKKNIALLEYGLWNENTTKKIYSPGTLAGSLFSGHQDVNENDFELCQFVNASEWFNKNISDDDDVYVKLNCEGAEGDILFDLVKSKEIFKIKNVMIDFDVKKVKGFENTQQDVLDGFENVGFRSYSLCEVVMKGPTHITRIQSWLDSAGANKTDSKSRINQFFYWAKMVILKRRPGYKWELKQIVKSHSPLFLLKLAGVRRK